LAEHEREEVQRDFSKFTAQKIRFDLVENNPELLKELKWLQATANTSSGKGIH